MKFLCDNCKAKYQIADEKVAGKTVRMKCRKCGHQIEVRAAVTEGTGSIPPRAPEERPGALPAAKGPPPRPGGGLATSLSAQKPKAPAAPPMAAPISSLSSAFAKNVADAPVSTLNGSANASASIELSVTDEWYVAINGVPVGPIRISELRRKAATGACNEDSLCWQEGLEEWRPIKSIPELAQIVREALAGNRASLTEGSGSARISSFPSAPRTPAAGSRQSTIPPAPGHHPSAPMTAAPMTPPMAPLMSAPRPAAPMAPAARSNVVPLRPQSAPHAPTMDDPPFGAFGIGGAALAPAPSPFAPPVAPPPQTAPLPMSNPQLQAADPFASPMQSGMAPSGQMAASPFSLAPMQGSMSPQQPANPMMGSQPSYADMRMSTPSFAPPQPSFSAMPNGIAAPMPVPVSGPEKKGTPLWFWPILVLFLGFGGGAAYFVFAKMNQPPPAPVVIQMPAPAAAPASSDLPKPEEPTLDLPANSAEPTGATANGKKVATGAKKPAGGTQPAQQGLDLGGLGGSPGGPNIGPGPGGGGGGGGLDQAGVERVVSAHRNGVKRTCWERGSNDQKSSVNVMITATVAPNGTVQNATSSGDDPVVGKCIENQVKTWSFPAPGSQTTINIPFKFVRQ